MIIDFHTHAFPDDLAPRAMGHLKSEAGDLPSYHNGTVADLLRSMDRAGIERSILVSTATKPGQFAPIFAWSKLIASERIIPFPSVHPDDPDVLAHIRQVADAGFKGLKIHPYYQKFDLLDDRMKVFFRAASEAGLIVVCHTGFDIAFPRDRVGDPARIAELCRRMPDLKFVATHMGAWEDYDEIMRHLAGTPVYIELSLWSTFATADQLRAFLKRHDPARVLFGTDAPWSGQSESLAELRALDLPPADLELILNGNACRLLGV